ncbi:MAG TPA: hypothetical protein VFL83_19860 [Anaeromyxobacter sp.]|nr:hypothetical protein [Anaeromyxobacter sp.]
MRHAAATLTVLVALFPAPAAAQPFDGTQGVDAFTGPLIAPSRITGLGGAYVAVAEGLGGAVVNPAAVAQREPRLARGWDWDWLLTWYVPDTGQLGRQDLGNDGGVDAGLSGAGNGQVGLSYQRGRLGVAAFGGGWNLAAPREGVGSVEMEILEASLAVGGSFRGDALVVGGSITTVAGLVRVAASPGAAPVEVEYSGSAIRIGALLRRRGSPWRIGAALRGEAHATPAGDRAALPVATPAEFVFPWVLSLGAARWFGPNAVRWNEPARAELERHPELGTGPAWQETRRRPVLVSVQLDLVGRTPGCVGIESALLATADAPASGERASVVPRAGAEWEPFAERFRIRGGTYLEPSRTGASPRLHGTFGLAVRVPFPWRALQLGVAGDVAERYRNVSLSLGFWSSVAPVGPPASKNPS